jgi:protein gp37
MTASPEPGRLAAARPVGARHTGISWTERTWALWGGCEPESEGCANCYAVFDAWRLAHKRRPLPWPLPNVWAGVSAETQRLFEERVPLLAGTRALTTYVSMEPLIERVAPRGLLKGISQVVVGGESERRRGAARPFDPAWIDPIFDDCAGSSTARFVKQFGTVWARARGLAGKGDDPSQWEPRYRGPSPP